MLRFIDETLRDGPQSLWATRMHTETMLEACPFIDAVGVSKATTISGASFETAVRFLNDDPWERLRLVGRYMPNTPVDILIRSRNLFGWSRYPDEVVELLFKCLQRNGATSVKIFDGLNDINTIKAHCRIGRKLGLHVTGMLTFSISPVHTDEYFAAKAREFADVGIDSLLVCDASGILKGDRAGTLLAAVRKGAGDAVPIEFYAHASMGLAHESYRAALLAGVSGVTTAAEPLANGESLPATADIARIAMELGIPVGLDLEAQAKLDDYMYWATWKEGKEAGVPVQFDALRYENFVEHQIPGGMISNFRNQLREAGLMHRLDDVLREAGRVRAELGYPIMVTPFSQFVGVQATLNVIQGERYKTVPNEVQLYALGYYGDSGTAIEPNVLDRILQGKPRERMSPEAIFDERIVEKFRRENGPFRSDEELLMHLFYGRQAVDTMQRNRNAVPNGVTIKQPLHLLIQEIMKMRGLKSIDLQKTVSGWNGRNVRVRMSFQS